jgi:hypothetical protein
MMVKTRAERARSRDSSPQPSAYSPKVGVPATVSFPFGVEMTGVWSFFGVSRCSNLGSRSPSLAFHPAPRAKIPLQPQVTACSGLMVSGMAGAPVPCSGHAPAASFASVRPTAGANRQSRPRVTARLGRGGKQPTRMRKYGLF